MIITTAEAKLHLRVSDSTDDALIDTLILAAEKKIEHFLNRDIPGFAESPAVVPPDIIAAAKIIVADLYENRGGATDKDIKENSAIANLLYPYRVGIGI